ncbi:hypothetical protein Acsp06_47110 [Actinomycetospora sp. NBRC 106375]|nr:hypothetical protein Acsp06_47110 [Actinomycetospora sp. NBRC 106375]
MTRRGLVGSAVAVALALGLLVLISAAPALASSPTPSNNAPIWVLPPSGNLFSGFSRNDYDEQDGSPQQVRSPDKPGQDAVEFDIPGGAQRSEMQPRIPNQVEGDVQYYTYGALLAPDFPTDTRTWQLILQWHHFADSGSPPVAVEVRDGRLMLAAEGTDLQDLGPVSGGDRVDLTLRIAFSRDPDQGTVDVWRDGRQVLVGYHPPSGTLLDNADYLKVGIYRDTSIDAPGNLWLDELRVGPTLASVQSPGSPSAAIPTESDPTSGPSGGGRGGSSETILWVAGGLLLVVVLSTAGSLHHRRRSRS